MTAPPTTCDITRIGMTLLSTSGARSRVVIKAPESINSSQAASAHEPRSLRSISGFMSIARRRDRREFDS